MYILVHDNYSLKTMHIITSHHWFYSIYCFVVWNTCDIYNNNIGITVYVFSNSFTSLILITYYVGKHYYSVCPLDGNAFLTILTWQRMCLQVKSQKWQKLTFRWPRIVNFIYLTVKTQDSSRKNSTLLMKITIQCMVEFLFSQWYIAQAINHYGMFVVLAYGTITVDT